MTGDTDTDGTDGTGRSSGVGGASGADGTARERETGGESEAAASVAATAHGDETARYYADHEFGGEVGMGERPALLVVDLINAFTDPGTNLGSDVSGVVEAAADLLAAFREHDLPRYFTTVAYEESYGDAGVFVEKVPALRDLRLGTPEVEVDDRVAPVGDERVLVKKYASAFFGTDLATELVTDRVDTLVLAGVTTSGCIRATAVDGLQHGYRVVVPERAVGDRAPGPHRANLFDIDAKYGDVVDVETVFAALDG